MKSTIFKAGVIFSFILAFILIASPEILADGPNLGQIDSQVQSATTSVKKWANWIIGAAVLVGTIFSVFALMNGNPQARNYVIGTVAGLVLWAVVNTVI